MNASSHCSSTNNRNEFFVSSFIVRESEKEEKHTNAETEQKISTNEQWAIHQVSFDRFKTTTPTWKYLVCVCFFLILDLVWLKFKATQ